MPSKPLNSKSADLEKLLEQKISGIAAKGKAQESEALAKSLGLPYSDLAGTPIDPEALALLPEETAR
ncbi:MAG: hypothetical protein L0312_06625, partial [Acidobacteria bacterium]|nr:hypothetical protein [Acidobacteriota bacterium]